MTSEFKKIELDITKEIVNIGLSKAADSLSFFIKERVLIQLYDLKINSEDFDPISKKKTDEKKYLLTTNIIGDFKGKAYLVFCESEVDKIIEANLPESLKNNPDAKQEMRDAFLLEIDNIITASVVTQFSNILQCKVYGGVPMLNVLHSSEINNYLSEKNSDDLNVIYFNSRFITDKININPEFIWFLEDKFFVKIKEILSDEKKMELLKGLKI